MREYQVEIYGSAYLDEDNKQVSVICSCKHTAESEMQVLQNMYDAKFAGANGVYVPIVSAAMIRITEVK